MVESLFNLAEEERAGCFALSVFLLLCGCYCLVPLPRGAMGWSCGISWSYSLFVILYNIALMTGLNGVSKPQVFF